MLDNQNNTSSNRSANKGYLLHPYSVARGHGFGHHKRSRLSASVSTSPINTQTQAGGKMQLQNSAPHHESARVAARIPEEDEIISMYSAEWIIEFTQIQLATSTMCYVTISSFITVHRENCLQ